MTPTRILLLTGVPGVGKTTLVRRVVATLEGLRLAGFTTEEIREGGQRRGFRIVPLAGEGRTMAHVEFRGPARVGRYGVDAAAIDAIAATSLAPHPGVDLTVVDEIGKMECLSEGFVAAMRALLDSDRRVLATIARRGGGFVAEVKRNAEAALWEVTARNRDGLAERIRAWVEERPGAAGGA
jgi:nucleoside-triphosphatase